MRQKLGVHEIMFNDLDFKGAVELTARCGLDVFSPTTVPAHAFGVAPAKKLLKDAGLLPGTLGSMGGFLVEGSERTFVENAKKTIHLAAELGCPTILVTPFGRPPGMTTTEGDQRTVAAMQRVVPLAQAAGVRLTLEPCHPVLHVQVHLNTLRDTLALCAQVDGLHVLADTSHLWWERTFLKDFKANVTKISAIQLSNVSEEALRGFHYDRPTLITGAIPMTSVVRAMDAAGYTGYYEIELIRFFPQRPGQMQGSIIGLPVDECERILREARSWWDTLFI